MLTVIIITIAIVAPLAAMRLATSRHLEWAAWLAVVAAAGSHVETWQLITEANQPITFGLTALSFVVGIYELLSMLAITTLLLENKSKTSKTN